MNNLYQWQNYSMVKLKMDEIKNEMDEIRLLQEASLSHPNWLKRSVIAVGNSLGKFGQSLRKEYTSSSRSSQATGSKHVA